MKAILLSQCCNEPDRDIGEDGPSYGDINICPKCKDHCDFVEKCGFCEGDRCSHCHPSYLRDIAKSGGFYSFK